jgi:hypothetical protein
LKTESSERESLSHLPAYVDERNRRADAAGLLLEKLLRRDALLSTWYSGTEAQLRSARLMRMPLGFVFPAKVGSRKICSVRVFCPAESHAELKCSVTKTADDRYRLAIVNELMPVAWHTLGGRIDVYKYCDLRDGANSGPATVYVAPLAALQAAGIAPAEAEHEHHSEPGELRAHLWESQPIDGGRHRFVVFHEAEARAHAQEEERGRSDFRTPEQYQDWLLEIVAASIGMIRRQLRVKTKRRYIYSVPSRTLKELEAHFARLRKIVGRSEILVQKEDVRGETRRAEVRRAALDALRDAEFQRFLGHAVTPLAAKKR